MALQLIGNWISTLILIVIIGILIILVSNLIGLKRLDQFPQLSQWPKISVLIPARNEEDNIRPCVVSFLEQNYPNFEVLVLNDESTDKTFEILQELAGRYPNLQIINGEPLPKGWMGKHWACHQLSKVASGELILFTDADTIHHSLTLREAASALVNQNADLLTAMPFEFLGTWGEKIMVPYIFLSTLFFIPITLAHHWNNPALCFSIGQFLLFKQTAYIKVGGHEAIKNYPMEDLLIGRRIKKMGMRWRMVDGSRRVRCRMYHDFHSAWTGLTRFLYLGYEGNIFNLIMAWFWSGLVFLAPLVILILNAFRIVNLSPLHFWEMLISLVLTVIIWFSACIKIRMPVYLAFIYPAIFIMNFFATLQSMILTKTGRSTWKGRPLFEKGL